MSKNKNQGAASSVQFVPELVHTFLPGCSHCRGAHPLARKPIPVNTDVCPDCGEPAGAVGETKVESATFQVHGWAGKLGMKCLKIADALSNLSKRI